MRKINFLFIPIICFLFSSIAKSEMIYVNPNESIQQAIDGSSDGDEIIGTFTLNIEFNGEEQSVEMDIIDGWYDEALSEFTCEIVPPDDSDNGILTATIDGDSMEGIMEGDGEETSFSATKN